VNGEELLHARRQRGIARAMGASDAAIAKNRGVQDQMNSIIKREGDPQVRARG